MNAIEHLRQGLNGLCNRMGSLEPDCTYWSGRAVSAFKNEVNNGYPILAGIGGAVVLAVVVRRILNAMHHKRASAPSALDASKLTPENSASKAEPAAENVNDADTVSCTQPCLKARAPEKETQAKTHSLVKKMLVAVVVAGAAGVAALAYAMPFVKTNS